MSTFFAAAASDLHWLLVSPFTFCCFLLLIISISLVAFYLPFSLTPAETFSRRSVLLLESLFCTQGGILLAAAVFVFFVSAVELNPLLSPSHDSTTPSTHAILYTACFCFIIGLLSPLCTERLLLWLCMRVCARCFDAADESASRVEGSGDYTDETDIERAVLGRAAAGSSSSAPSVPRSSTASVSSTPTSAPTIVSMVPNAPITPLTKPTTSSAAGDLVTPRSKSGNRVETNIDRRSQRVASAQAAEERKQRRERTKQRLSFDLPPTTIPPAPLPTSHPPHPQHQRSTSTEQSSLLPTPDMIAETMRDYRKKRPIDSIDDEDDDNEYDYEDHTVLAPHPYRTPSSYTTTNHHSYTQPSSSSYYTYGFSMLDASAFFSTQRYLSRCVFCKDRITTRKGLAYHAAGCVLSSVPSWSVYGRALGSVRGKRDAGWDDKYILPQMCTTIATLQTLKQHIIIGIAAGTLLVQTEVATPDSSPTPLPRTTPSSSPLSALVTMLVALSLCLMAYTFFTHFALSLLYRQQRCHTSTITVIAILTSSIIPLTIWLTHHAFSSPYATTSDDYNNAVYLWLSLCTRCYTAGVLTYLALVDIVMEEWERKEAKEGKWILFCFGFFVIVALQLLGME